jgi:hypothetical protein
LWKRRTCCTRRRPRDSTLCSTGGPSLLGSSNCLCREEAGSFLSMVLRRYGLRPCRHVPRNRSTSRRLSSPALRQFTFFSMWFFGVSSISFRARGRAGGALCMTPPGTWNRGAPSLLRFRKPIVGVALSLTSVKLDRTKHDSEYLQSRELAHQICFDN